MKRKTLSVFGSVALLALTLASGPTAADRVSLNDIDSKLDRLLGPSHPSNHVTLVSQPLNGTVCSSDTAYVRVNLDGTRDTTEFIVPAGYTLLLHDVSWQARELPTDFIAGRVLRLGLNASNPNGTASQPVYYSPKVEITSANQSGLLGASESVTAGVAVGEGRIVCAVVVNSGQGTSSLNSVAESVLRGYLVENP